MIITNPPPPALHKHLPRTWSKHIAPLEQGAKLFWGSPQLTGESPSSQHQFQVSHDLTYYPTVSSGPTDNHAHPQRLASLPGLPISSSAHPLPWMLLRTLLTHTGIIPSGREAYPPLPQQRGRASLCLAFLQSTSCRDRNTLMIYKSSLHKQGLHGEGPRPVSHPTWYSTGTTNVRMSSILHNRKQTR